jgi:hypothetical protein
MQSRIVFFVHHNNPLPQNLVTGMCQDDGPADALGAYLKEACGCTALLARVLPGESVYWVDADGCRHYVHVSEEIVMVTWGDMDAPRLRGVVYSRKSKHYSVFAGTQPDVEARCLAIAKEALK